MDKKYQSKLFLLTVMANGIWEGATFTIEVHEVMPGWKLGKKNC